MNKYEFPKENLGRLLDKIKINLQTMMVALEKRVLSQI
jgi:hypothetical protein